MSSTLPQNTFDNRPLGIFDSGLGGLTVAAALRRKLPAESVIYLGDTAHVPYGNKSAEAIRKFARADMRFMLSRGVKAVVAACNTVSAVAMDSLLRDFPQQPIFGMIESGAEAAIASGARYIAVAGTRATINSDAYRHELHRRDRSLRVVGVPCPLLVPLAEEGVSSPALLEEVLDIYFSRLKKNPPDALLLGCTHYPFFVETFERYFDHKVKIIDSANACAEVLSRELGARNLAACPDNGGTFSCFVTDLPAEFDALAGRFLGERPARVEKVEL